ncbi:MAG: hypothetical protein OHK0052_09540 [Anaerolineales bacterium]
MWLETLLIGAILIAPTIQYRLEFGAFSVALFEPIVLVGLLLLVVRRLARGNLYRLKLHLPMVFVLLLIVWAALILPFSANWQRNLSDLRDWLIPLLCYLLLGISTRQNWRRWVNLMLIWATLTALLGLYQQFTDSARFFINPLADYKTGFVTAGSDAAALQLVSYGVGLFSHPNIYGLYLLSSLLVLGGLVLHHRRHTALILLWLLIAFAFYGSYAKTAYLAALLSLVLMAAFWRFRKPENLLFFGAILIFAAVFAIVIAVQILPTAVWNTFWWRVNLWQIALQLLQSNPQILLWGNGMNQFGKIAFYGQPHNLYVYITLAYGLPGLLLLLASFGAIFFEGWRMYRQQLFAIEPRLLGLWFALLTYFAIGLLESSLLGIELRALFLTTLILWESLSREVRATLRVSPVPIENLSAPVNVHAA